MPQLIEKARLGRLNALKGMRRTRAGFDSTTPWVGTARNVTMLRSRRAV